MLVLDFINVGYGDALLLQEKEIGFAALIDCGAPRPECRGTGRIDAVRYLKQCQIKRLDVLVLTHLHQDHCGTVAQIVEEFDVQALWTSYLPPEAYWSTAVQCSSPLSLIPQKLADAMNSYLQALACLRRQGKTIRLIRTAGAEQWTQQLKVHYFAGEAEAQSLQQQIWPEVLQGTASQERWMELDRCLNQTSIRLRLEYGSCIAELPGDLSAENYAKQMPQPCTILKLAHHGHRDAMTQALLHRLNPEGVIVSVALEKGDICPDAQILELLKKQGCWIGITDEQRSAVRIELSENGVLKI